MRRTLRPAGPLAKRLALTDPQAAATIVAQANDGVVSAAPTKVPPAAILTPDHLADAASLPVRATSAGRASAVAAKSLCACGCSALVIA